MAGENRVLNGCAQDGCLDAFRGKRPVNRSEVSQVLGYLVEVDLLEAGEEIFESVHHEQLAVPHMGLPIVRPHPQPAHHRVQAPLPPLAHLAPCTNPKLVILQNGHTAWLFPFQCSRDGKQLGRYHPLHILVLMP